MPFRLPGPAAANATATDAPKDAPPPKEAAAKEPEAPPATAAAEGHKNWANTVDGIVRTTKEAWISGSGKIDKTMTCETAQRGDECWTAVTWAMNDGVYEHPEWWPELQPGASSFEEFQGHQHLMNATLCPQPCMLRYDVYSEPTYRSSREYAMKGVSYGASPLKSTKVLLTDDDFMTDITGAMWDSWGRGDLDVLASMGVNTLRMYGNDLNYSHRSFLDGAWKRDIDVIVGLSDWGFIQGPDPCDKHGWHCFNQVYEAYMSNLKKGFTIRNYTMYHPALKALIISNEPDLKVHPRTNVCRAMVTSLDAILQAEKDLNVTENPIALTVTYSFAAFGRQAPGLGQMEELYHCMKHPEKSPTNYIPKNDVFTAYKKRWVNSFNTAAPGHVVEELFLDKYAKSIFWSEIRLPVFIGEYHSVHVGAKEDLPILVNDALSSKYPFYLGYNFFEPFGNKARHGPSPYRNEMGANVLLLLATSPPTPCQLYQPSYPCQFRARQWQLLRFPNCDSGHTATAVHNAGMQVLLRMC
ncbi:ENDOU [Symbiodinium sp. CCMP2456]|nr:ENDOU [Symbiodinium sp. CCMP2456]